MSKEVGAGGRFDIFLDSALTLLCRHVVIPLLQGGITDVSSTA